MHAEGTGPLLSQLSVTRVDHYSGKSDRPRLSATAIENKLAQITITYRTDGWICANSYTASYPVLQ